MRNQLHRLLLTLTVFALSLPSLSGATTPNQEEPLNDHRMTGLWEAIDPGFPEEYPRPRTLILLNWNPSGTSILVLINSASAESTPQIFELDQTKIPGDGSLYLTFKNIVEDSRVKTLSIKGEGWAKYCDVIPRRHPLAYCTGRFEAEVLISKTTSPPFDANDRSDDLKPLFRNSMKTVFVKNVYESNTDLLTRMKAIAKRALNTATRNVGRGSVKIE